MKQFFADFKKFITRGNVMDLAIATIIGASFTAIVTALSNNILKPLINWIIAACAGDAGNALEKAYTILRPGYKDGVLDLASSIYIDWGAFISAIINFLLIALVLFIVMRAFMRAKGAMKPKFYGYTSKEYYAMRKEGKSVEEIEAMAKARDEKAAAEKAAADAEKAKHTTEALLEDIKALLEKQVNKD